MKTDIIDAVPAAFLTLGAGEYVHDSPTLRGEMYAGPPETLEARTAVGALSKLVHAADRAKDSSGRALSWRNYNVGASAVMFNFELGQFGLFDGFNVKPETGTSSLNLHAEQVAIAKGRSRGLNKVIGISVYADPFDDDANPNMHATLPPCSRCVQMFADIPEVSPNTLVLGSNLDLSVCELYTIASLTDPAIPKLVDEPFSLQTEDDLEHYDRVIRPAIFFTVMNLYTAS